MPTGAAFAARYDGHMLDSAAGAFHAGSGWFNVGLWEADPPDQAAACAALLAALAAPVPADVGRVLDVACGCGGTTAALARLRPAAEVIGINVSARQVGHARTHAPEARYAVMDAAQLAFADGTFDCVVCVEAAFHFWTRARFLAEAARVLRPGGLLVLSDILFASSAWVGAWMVPPENDLAGPDAYADALRRAGFAPVSITDAADRCWGGFCRHHLARAAAAHAAGTLDDRAHARLRTYLGHLLHDSVRAYLLVTAVRTADARWVGTACP